jgi:hypothetical protein
MRDDLIRSQTVRYSRINDYISVLKMSTKISDELNNIGLGFSYRNALKSHFLDNYRS